MSIYKFPLGVEELAMIYGLIGKPELGQLTLENVYEELSEAHVSVLMTSASHSMLARGICSINENGSVHLDEEVEKAFSPVVLSDYLVTFILDGQDIGNMQWQLFVSQKFGFTSFLVTAGVAYIVGHGTLRDLSTYIEEAFGVLMPDSFECDEENLILEIELTSLVKAMSIVEENKSPQKVFLAAGWHEETSQKITRDLTNQLMRGSVLRLNAGSEASEAEQMQASKPTLLFLVGSSKVWTFDFASPEENEIGIAQVCSWDAFIKKLQDFVL